jgi:hypothetical protein
LPLAGGLCSRAVANGWASTMMEKDKRHQDQHEEHDEEIRDQQQRNILL